MLGEMPLLKNKFIFVVTGQPADGMLMRPEGE